MLSLFGTVKNSGTISMGAAGGPTDLGVPADLTLSGGGKVTLSDDSHNDFDTNGGTVMLTNAGNTIVGAGTIGDAGLVLVNQAKGVIAATGQITALILDTGSNSIVNSGTLEDTVGAVSTSGATSSTPRSSRPWGPMPGSRSKLL